MSVDLASKSLSQRLLEIAAEGPCDEQPFREYDTGTVEGFERFCSEVLGIRVWSRQREIVQSYFDNLRTAVRSGHSVGKTTIVAAICVYHFSVRGLPFYTTAPGADAVNDGVWKEIRRLYQGSKRPLPGKIGESPIWKVDGAAGWWGKGFSTNKAERAQGRHEIGLLVVADEAAGLEEFVWDALESSMASEGVRMLIIGNPNAIRNTFYQAFHEQKDMWHQIHISSLESPNITKSEPGIPGLATPEWVAAQQVRYKDEPQKYRCRILGEFPETDAADKTLPMEWIESSQQLWLELEEEEEYLEQEPQIHSAFVDVAGWGKDNSALSYLRGQRFHVEFETSDKSDEGLMILATKVDAWVRSLPDHQKPKFLAVDCDAIGAGVYSRLAVLRGRDPSGWGRCQLKRFNWGGVSSKPKLYQYQIDELHWELRKLIDPSLPRHERLAIPPGKRIAAQLNLRKYSEDVRERIKVETKEQLKKRNAKSPDVADSIVGCMYRPKIASAVAIL
jgi:phage terminase large subunit